MSFTKFANFESAKVLDVKGSSKQRIASLDKVSDFDDYRTDDNYLYVRIRAISSRVNKNHDGWPSIELAGGQKKWEELTAEHKSSSGFRVQADTNDQFGFSTFIGKPVFVDHHNTDPKRARGVIVDAALNVLDHKTAAEDDSYWGSENVDPEHLPPTEVELLLEVDAENFPKLAKAIVDGDIDGFSMGCFVPGTPVTLADGTRKPIEDIVIDDEVLTHTGKTEPVTYIMKRPFKGLIYEVDSFGQSESMKLTEEHPVWVKRIPSKYRDKNNKNL
jgi:hypothetical protein